MESLPDLLRRVLSPENAQRVGAEQQLEAMSAAPGFLLAVVDLCSEHWATTPPSILMVSLSVLKQRMTARTPPGELADVAARLLDRVLFNANFGASASSATSVFSAPQVTALMKQSASVATKAIMILEDQVTEGDRQAATEALTAVLNSAFQHMSTALSTVVSAPPPLPQAALAAATTDGPLPMRAVVLLQEMADTLPQRNCVTRNEYLLSAVPTLFQVAVHGTPQELLTLGNPNAFLGTVSPSLCARVRLQVAAARVLATLYAQAATAWRVHASYGDEVAPLPDSETFLSLGTQFVSAMQEGMAARLISLRLSASAAVAQQLLSSPSAPPGALPSSLSINTLLSLMELECQLLGIVPVAAKCRTAGQRKAKPHRAGAGPSPQEVAYAHDLLKSVHEALREDVATYHQALLVDAEDGEDVDEEGAGLYEQGHTDDTPLDVDEAWQAYHLKVRKCSELRWRYLEAAAGAMSSPAKAARKKFLRAIHTNEGLANGKVAFAEVNAFFNVFLQYAWLSLREAAQWVADPNVFLQREDEKDLVWAVRDVVALTMTRYCRALGDYFTQIALENLFGVLAVAAGASDGLESHLTREAAMFLMDSILTTNRKEVLACGEADYLPLVDTLLASDASSANAAVAARALILLGTLLTFLAQSEWRGSSTTAAQRCSVVLPAAVASLAAQGPGASPPLLRACACRLLLSLLPLASADVLHDTFTHGNGQAALLSLLVFPSGDSSGGGGASGEMLYLVLDVLSSWLARLRGAGVPSHGAEYRLPTAHTALFACWRCHLQDPNVDEAILSVFAEYIRSPAGDEAFVAELPWLQHLLLSDGVAFQSGGGNSAVGASAELCSVPGVVQLLTQVFLRGSDRAANATASAVLDALCVLLLSTEESAILDASSACLATLLRRCPQAETVRVMVPPSLLAAVQRGVHSLTDPVPGPHDSSFASATAHIAALDEERVAAPLTTVLLGVVLRMLHPQRQEVSLFNVGRVLVAIVEHAPHFSEEEVRLLIDTVAHRLESVQTPSVAQQLIAPLSGLLKAYPAAFLQVLREGGMLSRTFARWLPQVRGFFGKRDVLRSCDALIRLLTHWEQSGLAGVTVPWVQGGGGDGTHGAGEGRQRARGSGKHGARKGKRLAGEELPLDLAAFLSIGQSLVVLTEMLESGEWWEMERAEQLEEEGDTTGGGGRLWRESDSDSAGEEDEVYEDVDDDGDDIEEDAGGPSGPATAPHTQQQERQEQTEARQRESAKEELRAVFGALPALLSRYGPAVTPFFDPDELETVQRFFEFIQGP